MHTLGTIIGAVVMGTILGALARLFLPGKQHISVWLTILVGIAAALVGGFIAQGVGVGHILKFVIQLIVAMVFVYLAAHFMGGGAKRSSTAH